MPTSTLSRGEVAQGGGHDAHQPVEHDLQHRQALVGDEAGADDLLHAGAVLAARGTVVEAEQAVDLGLVEHARRLPRRRRRLARRRRSPRPRRRRALRRSAGRSRFVAHWISIWVNSTSVTCAGAGGEVGARDQFLAQPVGAGGAAQLLGPHLAQIGLEQVLQPRHRRLSPPTSSSAWPPPAARAASRSSGARGLLFRLAIISGRSTKIGGLTGRRAGCSAGCAALRRSCRGRAGAAERR